ncbi:NADH:ubiquinone reductase (Na(+)-transporting) subunit F [Ammoniphilus sp. YIM 78166]|uniref:NADH:ubiquinone reductase (Na(+)-transporting) subunit F n=1 Tax=Ammoniphilus sp. YIM 78166 TaxID=1644106 RepID=UPI001F105D82|nr:2Fe-2S iron-sulfur cluster-binding protein [Ammoniphilus sp. YIM 78166]
MSLSQTRLETYEVTLEPSGKTIIAKEGQTLLDAAIRNGIQIPYGCRHGSCSACKAQVIEGDYKLMDRVSEYSLMSFEREEGFVLLCSTVAESDLVVEIEEEESDVPFFPVYDFQAAVVDNVPSTPDIHIITLKLTEPTTLRYAAGQFFEFDIPGLEDTRAYSMANPCREDGTVQFHVKRIPNGKGSNYMCDLKPGDFVTGSAPYGKMQLRDRSRDMVFVAGGSGMAPIKALIEELFSSPYEGKAYFFYGARTVKDLYLVEEWKELEKKHPNFRFIPALSHLDLAEGWAGETGFIADVVKRTLPSMKGMDAFLCGPPIMIETTVDALSQGGIKGSDILYDEF